MKFRIQHCGLHCGDDNDLLTNARYADNVMAHAGNDTDRASMVASLVEELAAAGWQFLLSNS